ncbi:FeoA family protein [Luteolibacter sp. SL250]|uniref:FeoA family protein n=1 Tax=Luteolibacter sp. SL250 TaxID=2995170 RepID=UPI00226EE2F7|nr:FeoA family protein [Luteolibacter sp. SL250]WAC18332.1 FeoA family protein [Luteolibacter sp. SL250]
MPIRPADAPESTSAKTLNEVEAGRDFRISGIDGPSSDRLRDLGFREETQIRKLSGGRNLVCSISGTRLAISKELAAQVFVSPVF